MISPSAAGVCTRAQETEVKRLHIQHEWLKAGVSGQLIMALLDSAMEGMSILGSGTVDGKTHKYARS